ncbi:hypothetical protein J4Q44_G00015590 [Coregonus suidteri]|uniref:Integral membrane protein GPR137B n=1 Tax=Coregonus suidteri TaxID=861788 RepID=A0AAN8NKE2_9TELE
MEAQVRDLSLLSPPTLTPAVPHYVKLGLTVVYTVFYSLLFLFIYLQLWMVLRYKHKRLSYQTVFLFLCLLWAALRAVLFSFYFGNFVTANTLAPFPFWLLYCSPVCLQFFTLSLMNLYFVQVVFKAKSKYAPELLKYRLPLCLLFLSIINLTCALLVRMSTAEAQTVVLVRVAINDTLFVLCAISLSLCLYKIAKMSLANIYLESKGTSVCQVTAHRRPQSPYSTHPEPVTTCLVLLAAHQRSEHQLLPTTNCTMYLTRRGRGLPGHVFSSRAYFFDDPRRYDSDDDLVWSIIPQNIQASYDCSSSSTVYIGGEEPHTALPPEELNSY